MKLLLHCAFVLLFSSHSFAQAAPIVVKNDEKTQQTLEVISTELTQLTKSFQTFNQRLNDFLESVNKYKGIQLSEKQQKLLFGYVILN